MQLGVVQQWRKILFELWQKVQEGPKATDCEWEGSSCVLEKHLQRDSGVPVFENLPYLARQSHDLIQH